MIKYLCYLDRFIHRHSLFGDESIKPLFNLMDVHFVNDTRESEKTSLRFSALPLQIGRGGGVMGRAIVIGEPRVIVGRATQLTTLP